MTKLQKLMNSEALSAEFRGHTIGWTFVSEKLANGTCLHCGMELQVFTAPMPNEIDIGGEAVALNCTGNKLIVTEI